MVRMNNEILMEFIEAIFEECGDSLVLKGALALNMLFAENSNDINHRFSEDFDSYLLRMKMKFSELEAKVQVVLDKLDLSSKVRAVTERHPKNHSSGRIVLYYGMEESDGKEIFFSLDIDVDNCEHTYEIELPSGRLISCASIECICADKIDAISKAKLFFRVKDIYDIYLISIIYKPGYRDIKQIYDGVYRSERDKERIENKLSFKEFRDAGLKSSEPYLELADSYDKLTDIRNPSKKPAFDDVYARVRAFLKPFMTEHLSASNAIWSVEGMDWIADNSDLFGKPKSAVKGITSFL